MDPITVFGTIVIELLKTIRVAMEGQTPEQKKILWDIYIADVLFWRKLLKIDG